MYRQMQLLKSSNKKIYQYILSAKEPTQELAEAIKYLSCRALQSSQHFQFLLHRVNWFQKPLTNYQEIFLKIMRIYRSKSKQSGKVIYNLLIQSFINSQTNQQALNCLIDLFQQSYDKKTIIQCLKENYPHKLCNIDIHMLYLNSMIKLCKKFMAYRMDFLEIIIENLVNFDTEIISGDQWVHKPFPQDQKIIALREINNKNELSQKFDKLLFTLINFMNELDNDDKIIGQMLLVFQNKILPIKTTKLIHFIVFIIAQSNKNRANTFISFLLGNIFDKNVKENSYRIFTQSNFYLFSYILRSKRLSKSTIAKILHILIEKINEKLTLIDQIEINQHIKLQEIYNKNEMILMILQTVIIIKTNNQDIVSENELYANMISASRKKLQFQYFLRQEILDKIQCRKKESNSQSIIVKFSNKFLPATLPLIGCLIDHKMKIYEDEQDISIMQFQPKCRKFHKGEAPTSYCSQTVV